MSKVNVVKRGWFCCFVLQAIWRIVASLALVRSWVVGFCPLPGWCRFVCRIRSRLGGRMDYRVFPQIRRRPYRFTVNAIAVIGKIESSIFQITSITVLLRRIRSDVSIIPHFGHIMEFLWLELGSWFLGLCWTRSNILSAKQAKYDTPRKGCGYSV